MAIDDGYGREDMIGIKGFRGIHALGLTIVSILLFGATFGVLTVGLGILVFDVAYRLISGKPVLQKYLGF